LHMAVPNRRQALRAGDRRPLALDREALIVWYVHVALRPHQPNATIHDGALASVDDIAVIVVDLDVLTIMGEHTSETARLDEAIAAYDEALGVLASGGTEDEVKSSRS
jgi:hypothetical protein